MLAQGVLLAAYAAFTAASWDGNINYRSPSLTHAPLVINTEKVKNRMLTKRDGSGSHGCNVTFTHGIASGDPFADSVILWTRASPTMENDASNVTVEGLVPYFSHETEKYIKASTSLICEYVYEITNDAGRSIMGSHQENWFFRQLTESKERGATWRVIGNQMIFSRINMTGEGDREFPVDVDAWDGYVSSRNRTLQHLYDNEIDNTIMLAGDSHQSWVSDLVWLDSVDYDPISGAGAVGVEFAVTGTTSDGLEGSIAETQAISEAFVRDNDELQWQEGYYRGYTELHISPERVEAQYWGCPTVATRNAYEISLANFTVVAGANHLARPIGGGVVEAGAIKEGQGEVIGTNATRDLETGEWMVHSFDTMFLDWALEW